MDAGRHIQQALQRSAALQLQSVINRQMQERMQGVSTRCMDEDAFLAEVLNTPSSNSQAIRDLTTVIYSCTHKLLICQDTSLAPSISEKAVKEQTRKIIMAIIKKQFNNLQNVASPQSHQNHQIKIKQEDLNLHVSPPASWSPSVLEEAYSSGEGPYQSQSLAVESFPEAIEEEVANRRQYSQKQWRQTKQQALHSGHFLLGDKMATIRKLVIISGQLCGVVQWKERGLQAPTQSIMEIATIREHAPRELATFLEKQVAFLEE